MSTKKVIYGIAQAFILVSYLSSTVANAQPDQQSGERRGPPPQAIAACSDQPEGAACSFSGRRGDVTGSCIVPPQGEEELVCAPAGGPPIDRAEQ
jgi:hypothetical protein